MNSLKLLLALALALVFTGCEITVVDDSYTTSYYYKTYDCDLMYSTGDVRDVRSGSCSSLSTISGDYAFDFSPSAVIEYYSRGGSTTRTNYYVNDVYAFSYGGASYITYDVGGGMIFEYNKTDDEVGVYQNWVVYYYTY